MSSRASDSKQKHKDTSTQLGFYPALEKLYKNAFNEGQFHAFYTFLLSSSSRTLKYRTLFQNSEIYDILGFEKENL